MRLIDADRLETVMSETVMVIIRNPKMDTVANVMAAVDEFGKIIHNAPFIDAVPVVRCKDCVWCGKGYYCTYHDMYVEHMDWFCADGERKDDV